MAGDDETSQEASPAPCVEGVGPWQNYVQSPAGPGVPERHTGHLDSRW